MPNTDVLFSIVIACYKQEELVRASVESALSQGHASKEIIVVDDASPDGTADVLRTFGDAIILSALAVNGGACAARNHGASLAKGKYLVFLDGDDVLMPWTLEVYSRLINECAPKLILGRSAVCYGDVPTVTPGDCPHEIRFVEYAYFFCKDRPWVYNTSSLVVERAAFNSTDGWTKDIFYQDIQDLMNQLAVAGRTVLLLAPQTVWYRIHSTNVSFTVGAVSRFLAGIRMLLAKAKSGAYPGGRELEMKRSVWFGGLIWYWIKQAFRRGLYREGFSLLASKGWMVLLACIWRGKAWIVGRRRVEILHLGQSSQAGALIEMGCRQQGGA